MTDFVIIGGGVYGCATAWALAKQGADVCLLEAKTLASGASGGLGKRGVRAAGRDIRELPLMRESYEIWPQLHTELDGETGYERMGQLIVIEREIDCHSLALQPWVQQQFGIPTTMLSQAELRAIEPAMSHNMLGAVLSPSDGIADHTATTRSYAEAARRLGADIREQTAAVKLERNDNRVTAIITNRDERIEVKRGVLLASNLHALSFVQAELNITLPVFCMYPQVMQTVPVDPQPVRHLISHAHRTLAAKAVGDNQVMISGGWRGRLNLETGIAEPDAEQVAGNFAQAVAVYPSLEGVAIDKVSVERPELISYDGIPIIDRLAGAENMIVATGWCGHGWAIAPATSQHIATWLLTNRRPEILEPFHYGRFVR